MADTAFLVDTSVLGRAHQTAVGDRLEQLVRRGLMWSCRMIDLEVAHAARSRDVLDMIRERSALPEAPIDEAVMDRAAHVAGLLSNTGLHRGAKPVDLVVAASAELSGLTVLHYDSDYDRVATVTHQPTEWVSPADTLD